MKAVLLIVAVLGMGMAPPANAAVDYSEPFETAQAKPRPRPNLKKDMVRMTPKQAAKVRAGWKKQEARKYQGGIPKPPPTSPAVKKKPAATAKPAAVVRPPIATAPAARNAGAAAAAAAAIQSIGTAAATGESTTPAPETDPLSGSPITPEPVATKTVAPAPRQEPTPAAAPIKAAAPEPQEEEYAPNSINWGGIGKVGGLGKVGGQ